MYSSLVTWIRISWLSLSLIAFILDESGPAITKLDPTFRLLLRTGILMGLPLPSIAIVARVGAEFCALLNAIRRSPLARHGASTAANSSTLNAVIFNGALGFVTL